MSKVFDAASMIDIQGTMIHVSQISKIIEQAFEVLRAELIDDFGPDAPDARCISLSGVESDILHIIAEKIEEIHSAKYLF